MFDFENVLDGTQCLNIQDFHSLRWHFLDLATSCARVVLLIVFFSALSIGLTFANKIIPKIDCVACTEPEKWLVEEQNKKERGEKKGKHQQRCWKNVKGNESTHARKTIYQ